MIEPDKNPSGRWRARYTDPDGKMRSAGTFETKKAAWAALREKEHQLRRGEWESPDMGMIRFEDWAPTALNRLGKDGKKLAVRSRMLHEGQLTRHILPTFAKMNLRDIRRRDILNWVDSMPDIPSTTNLFMVLRGILRVAVEQEELKANPAATIKVRNYTKDRPTLQVEEFNELLRLGSPTMKLLLLVTFSSLEGKTAHQLHNIIRQASALLDQKAAARG